MPGAFIYCNLLTKVDKRRITDDGKQAAADGAHDDLVMASAIAHFIANDYEHQLRVVDSNKDILKQFYENNYDNQDDGYFDW